MCLLADLLGLTWAIGAVAALTFISGALVAATIDEALRSHGSISRNPAGERTAGSDGMSQPGPRERRPIDFDQLASRYDAWYATPIGAWADRHEAAAIFRLLALRPGERLLDVGTGTGRYAIQATGSGASIVGLDASAAMLAVAHARTVGQPVTLVRADATRLPFAAGSFDAALAVTSLCFAVDPLPALREIARVLRPDGRLVLGELNRWSLWALVRRIEGLIRPTT